MNIEYDANEAYDTYLCNSAHKKRPRLKPESDEEHKEGKQTYMYIDNSNESICARTQLRTLGGMVGFMNQD